MTQKDRQSGAMVDPVQAVRLVCSEVRTPIRLGCDEERKISSEVAEFTLARKAAFLVEGAPVPQTDTGRRGENPKTIGGSVVKELGKIIP